MPRVNGRSHITCIRLFPLAIPLRKPFRHAAHERATADPLVIEVELADGTRGYGETLPRPYVSGENLESVIGAIRDPFMEELLAIRPNTFAEALERIDALPDRDDLGRVVTAARAGLELALLDAYSRHFNKPISAAVGWLGLPGLGEPGSLHQVRYSGVLSGDDVRRLRSSVLKMRLYGLRDFKLKVGYEDDLERVQVVRDALRGILGRGTTLRVDANGGWTPGEAAQYMTAFQACGVWSVEQPLERGLENELIAIRQTSGMRVMHDESLVTMADAEELVQLGVADAFNIRISKNGGFLAAVRLAHFCRRHQIAYQLGCMVGETSILSAAGRRFLENVPGVVFAEGSYGRFLLRGDVTRRPINLSFGGRPRPIPGLGWGIDVSRELLQRYVAPGTIEMPL